VPDGLTGPIPDDQDPSADSPDSPDVDDSALTSPETPQPSDETVEKRIRNANGARIKAEREAQQARTDAQYWRSVAEGKAAPTAEPEDPVAAYYQQRWLIAEEKQARQTFGDEVLEAVAFFDEALARTRDPRTGVVPSSAKAQALVDAINFLVGSEQQPTATPQPAPQAAGAAPPPTDSNRSDVSPDLDLQRLKAEAEQKKDARPYFAAQIARLWEGNR